MSNCERTTMPKNSTAVNEELEEKETLERLLSYLSKKNRNEQAKNNNNKSKDRGGNDGKKRREKNTAHQEHDETNTSQHYKEQIRNIILSHNITSDHIEIDQNILTELTHDQKILINWDYEGVNIGKDESLLSDNFKEIVSTPKETDCADKYSYKDYDLNNIPCWSEMRKFDNFRKMSKNIRIQLASIGCSPDKLKELNIYDVGYLIKKHNSKNFPNVCPCQRTKYLKMFASCYGKEFLRIETMLGRGETASDFLDYIKQINTNRPKTPKMQIAADLYNIHHIRNRQHANEIHDYSKVNDFSNMTICYANPYHVILHLGYNNPKSDRHIKSLNLNSQIVYLGGFRQEFFILRNPAVENLYNSPKKSKNGGRNE